MKLSFNEATMRLVDIEANDNNNNNKKKSVPEMG